MKKKKNKKFNIGILLLIVIIIVGLLYFKNNKDYLLDKLSFIESNEKLEGEKIEGTVLFTENDLIIVKDNKNIIYKFNVEQNDLVAGDYVILEYTGELDKNKDVQSVTIIKYEKENEETDENGIPLNWLDNGIFSDYYMAAYSKLKELSLEEKIAQLLLVRYPKPEFVKDLKKYNFGGVILFGEDFKGKTKAQVIDLIEKLQKDSKIPFLTAVDEEGGIVVRISNNPKLRKERFKSPQELYKEGGFDLITRDTKEKSIFLSDLGINLNLAPVVDISINPNDYIYSRTLGLDEKLTASYSKTVIQASKGLGVSYTLKHFPGYASNSDTHTGSSIDNRTYEEILNEILPFKEGINVGAEAVLINHNIVKAIDSEKPASLSINIHNLLRDNLNFTGISITDDISMDAVSNLENVELYALLSGNNLIITSDYEKSFTQIKSAVTEGKISEKYIDELVFKVLAWKYYKEIMHKN